MLMLEVDEQGYEFPPADAPVARIQMFGEDPDSTFNGKLVQIVGRTGRYIRVEGVDERLGMDGYTLCTPSELTPLNDYTVAVINALWGESAAGMVGV